MIPVPIFFFFFWIHFKFSLLGREGKSVGCAGSPLFPISDHGLICPWCFSDSGWGSFCLVGTKYIPLGRVRVKSHMAISSGCHRLPGFSTGTLDTLGRDREGGGGVGKGEVRSLVARWLLGKAKPLRMFRWVLL